MSPFLKWIGSPILGIVLFTAAAYSASPEVACVTTAVEQQKIYASIHAQLQMHLNREFQRNRDYLDAVFARLAKDEKTDPASRSALARLQRYKEQTKKAEDDRKRQEELRKKDLAYEPPLPNPYILNPKDLAEELNNLIVAKNLARKNQHMKFDSTAHLQATVNTDFGQFIEVILPGQKKIKLNVSHLTSSKDLHTGTIHDDVEIRGTFQDNGNDVVGDYSLDSYLKALSADACSHSEGGNIGSGDAGKEELPSKARHLF